MPGGSVHDGTDGARASEANAGDDSPLPSPSPREQAGELSAATSGAVEGDEGGPQEGGGDGDLESQVTKIVGRTVALKAALLEEKLKYWHDQVDKVVESRFSEQNRSWYAGLNQVQLDVATQHHSHIVEIEAIRRQGIRLEKGPP